MQILIALIIGASYGALLHFLMAGRDLRGAALAPLLGAAVAGVTWLAFTWAGAPITEPWIWLASIAVPVVVVPIALIALTRVRTGHDERERARLGI
ncbi:GlsB/YeaQ/YmgE family stress response membrane protein [Microbacterium sp. bgisy189]|uniref:GlsB/YeaQ/YmgE family stress response membrane protein n=1 Tax=Microbacterium sp. bgisy189 TaxID=3413798 RepID=UPI003EB77952